LLGVVFGCVCVRAARGGQSSHNAARHGQPLQAAAKGPRARARKRARAAQAGRCNAWVWVWNEPPLSPFWTLSLRWTNIKEQRPPRKRKEKQTQWTSTVSTVGMWMFGNDPSAGSPTETLLRLLLPLDDKVWVTSQRISQGEPRALRQSENLTGPSNR